MFGKKVMAQATILMDEGYKWVSRGSNSTKQRETYIIEVHPEGQAPFRAEVKAWVDWPSLPRVGDTVNVWWKPGTQKVQLALKGDLRYDGTMIAERERQAAAAEREQLLHASPQPQATSVAPGAGTCPSCGQARVQGEAFCHRCGHRYG